MEICGKLEIPKKKRHISITKKEAEVIYNFLKSKKITKTLETGFAFGFSAAYIMSATKSIHYAMDPFQKKDYDNLGLKNIKKLGFSKNLKFENDFSHNVLPKLLKEKVKLEFAFIDGGHKFDDTFVDFYYIDLLLKKDGYILFHDAWMRSTQHVVSWIKNNKKNYRFLKTPYKDFILVKKIGEDNRKWYHFKGFCTFRSWFSHFGFKLNYKGD